MNNDCNRFVEILAGSVLLITAMAFLSDAIQNTRGYSLPQGLWPGSLLQVIFVPLFLCRQKAEHLHNNMIESTARYNVRRAAVAGSDDVKLGRGKARST